MRKLVKDEECRTLFCDIGLEGSACVHCTMRNVLFGSLHICETTRRETDCSFKCSFTPESGTRCQFCSTTRRGLISHMVRAHGFYDPVQRAVITNECPWCRSIFSTRLDAQHHACSSFLHGFCRAGGSHVQTEIKQPLLPVECPLCKIEEVANQESESSSLQQAESVLLQFSSVSDFYDHIIRCHLSLPGIPRARFARVAQFRCANIVPTARPFAVGRQCAQTRETCSSTRIRREKNERVEPLRPEECHRKPEAGRCLGAQLAIR